VDGYDLHEARYIQDKQSISAANADTVSSGVVPAQKIWTVIGGGYFPSVAETKIVQFQIVKSAGSYVYPVTLQQNIALDTTRGLPLVSEGMELKLYPGEWIAVVRDSHTAGSTMILNLRVIESDLPYYAYVDPLAKVAATQHKHGSVNRPTGGIASMGTGFGPGRGRAGGGGGGAEPV
jgi:DNA-directed RNA polymerase subunit H (RpoH/RPB5)